MNQYSENITFDTVKVQSPKETGRVIAAFADSFHFSGCKGQITIKNCLNSGTHDDSINIHGTHLKVVKKVSERIINLEFMNHLTYGFDAFIKTDTLNFVHPRSLEIYGNGIVEKVEKLSDRVVQITLEESLPNNFELGDVVENDTWTPSVLIKDNYFSGTNTRRVLLTTQGKVLLRTMCFIEQACMRFLLPMMPPAGLNLVACVMF